MGNLVKAGADWQWKSNAAEGAAAWSHCPQRKYSPQCGRSRRGR